MNVVTEFEVRDPWAFVRFEDGRVNLLQLGREGADPSRLDEVRSAIARVVSEGLRRHQEDLRDELDQRWQPISPDHEFAMRLAREALEEARRQRPSGDVPQSWFPDQADGREGQTHVSIRGTDVVELDVPDEVLRDYTEAGRVLARVVNQALERIKGDVVHYANSRARGLAPSTPDWAELARQADRAARGY